MKRRAAKLLALTAFILITGSLLLAGTAHADTIGKISAVEGKADLLKAGQSAAISVEGGEDISAGDILRTKSASKAGISFADNSSVRLAQNTRLVIKDFQIDDKGKRVSALLNVERGKIRAEISKGAKDSFIITTPNAISLIRGTDIIVLYQKSTTGISVIEGKVSVSGSAELDKPVELTSGNATIVLPDQSPSAPRALMAMEKKAHETDTDIKPASLALRKGTDKDVVAEGYSQQEGTKAAIINLSGSVQVKGRGAVTWHDAKKGEILAAGDSVQTKDNGKAELRLDNNNIINLKPGTVFVIEKLTYDGKTGEYENLFECRKGQLRAKVEKLKGNSKFEIKTPTAVASVRGTIFFLNFLSNLTSTYFEEGNGVLKSTISGIIQNVAAGSSSGADGNGNVSNPAPVTDEQRSQWNEGWDVEGGAEGYSGPGGYSGGNSGGTNGNPDTNWSQSPFSDKPVTDTIGTGGGTTSGGSEGGGTTVETSQITGTTNKGVFGLYGEGGENNHFEANLTSTVSTVPWSGLLPTSLSGTYANPGEYAWWGDVAGEGEDGGIYEGWLGGSWHSWDGVFASIYVDETGRAGQLLGLLSGTNSGEGGDFGEYGSFTGNGFLAALPMAQLETGVEYRVEYADGWGETWLSFDDGDGWFDSEFFREKKRIEEQNWGVWRELHDAYYYNDGEAENWTGVAGGDYNEGYFFTTVTGSDDLEGAIAMDVAGAYLDYDVLGAYYGVLLGADSGDDYYQVYGGGGFVEEPLSSSGWLSNALYSYDGWNGYMYGPVGTVGDLWGNVSFELASIGEFYNYYGYEPFIWYSGGDTLYSYDPYNETYITYDGGAFYGITAGDGQYGELLGLARALYIDPDGNAGVMSGDLEGAYSNDIWMYLLQGELTKMQMVSAGELGISAEDLYDNIWETEVGDGYLAGSFETGGDIQGYDDFQTLSIVDYEREIAQPWGVYGQAISGNYVNLNPNSETETVWSGVMGGNDAFGAYYYRYGEGEGESYFNNDYGYWIADVTNGTWDAITENIDDVFADLHGAFITYTKMGTLDGKIMGIYDEEGTWQGVGAGVWEGERLTLSGLWGNEYCSLYYDDNGYMEWAGEEWGLIGSTVEQWWNEDSFPILAMGEFDNYEGEDEDRLLWNTPVESYNTELDNSTTLDGGAFKGFTAGIWKNGLMSNGSVWAIYAANGTVGLLHGDISGGYSDELEMWLAEGTLYRQAMGGTVVSPDEFFRDFTEDDYHAEYAVGGSFDGINLVNGSADESTYHIADNPWGLFNITLAGGWQEPLYYGNANEDAVVLGYYDGIFGGYEFDSTYYELVTITDSGVSGSKGIIVGDVFGTAIDLENNVMYTLSGDARGIYNDRGQGYSTFALSAIGGWEEKPLVTGGMLTEGAFGYYDALDNDVNLDYEYINGVIGSSEALWGNSPEFTILGNFNNPDCNEDGAGDYNLWGTDFIATTGGNSVLYGSVGGTTLNNSLKGMLAAIYVRNAGDLDGNGYDDYRAGYVLSSDEMGNPAYVNGAFYPSIDMFDAYGNMTAYLNMETVIAPMTLLSGNTAFESGDFDGTINGNVSGFISGEHIQLYDQNWGLWRASVGGTYSESLPTGAWNSVMAGEGDRTYGRGPWVAVMSGTGWTDNGFLATMNGVSLIGTNLSEISGNIAGAYNDTSDWEALALGRYEQIIDLKEEHIITNEINVAGNGWGNIDGVLMAGLFGGEGITNPGINEGIPDTGTFSGILAGTGIIENGSDWKLAVGAKSYDDGYVDGYLLATADSSDGFHGVYFGLNETPTFTVGRVDGSISDITNVDTTWNANVTGEWVDLAELATSALGFNQVALANMVNVPITETYTALLQGGNTGPDTITSITMDTSFYTGGLTQIWASIINGNYIGTPTSYTPEVPDSGWSVSVADTVNGYAANLTNGTWSAGTNSWTADVVNGSGPSGVSFSGQAAGTFADGSLQGVGAGTWAQGQGPN